MRKEVERIKEKLKEREKRRKKEKERMVKTLERELDKMKIRAGEWKGEGVKNRRG